LEVRLVGWVEEVAAEEPLGDIAQMAAVKTDDQRGEETLAGLFVFYRAIQEDQQERERQSKQV